MHRLKLSQDSKFRLCRKQLYMYHDIPHLSGNGGWEVGVGMGVEGMGGGGGVGNSWTQPERWYIQWFLAWTNEALVVDNWLTSSQPCQIISRQRGYTIIWGAKNDGVQRGKRTESSTVGTLHNVNTIKAVVAFARHSSIQRPLVRSGWTRLGTWGETEKDRQSATERLAGKQRERQRDKETKRETETETDRERARTRELYFTRIEV